MIELGADPHSILGAHEADGGGVVVRTYRPEAKAVRIQPQGVEATLKDASGLWEAMLPKAKLPLAYELEVRYHDGSTYTVRDPYAFLPTLGELDIHLVMEGRHEDLYTRLGAHVREIDGVTGTSFAVWAPNARSVAVVGDFNSWDGRLHRMRSLGSSGIWELFIPDLGDDAKYKFEIRTQDNRLRIKADPVAFYAEVPPGNASVVHRSRHEWADAEWLERRAKSDALHEPMSIYEVHLGSWRRNPLDGDRSLNYLELADELSDYVADLGFTHIELMPIMEHPFSGSWGYQVSGYYAPTSRFGKPDDFRTFVDRMHQNGIGVLLDWVPAHFPRDDWALATFDGTHLYEHSDPRRGTHPDWGTLIFNLSRTEVKNFLFSNALYWLKEHHIDGLRVDAVASMLYLDYSRKEGEWLPNEFGGRENLEAVDFLKEVNVTVYGREPGITTAAEESTAWPGVSRPVYLGGLGFGFKWNMGWMHDTLTYFQKDAVYRRFHHHTLTFSMMYAFSENFILPLSHDEVVHGKKSLLDKMPGDRWQKFANLRSLYTYMWAHPGKKLLFMGGELAEWEEWNHDGSLHWNLLEYVEHHGVQSLVRDLNRIYRSEPALYEVDFEPKGFRWLEANDAANNVLAFARLDAAGERPVVCVMNLSPVPRYEYRVGMPMCCRWKELLNSDSTYYGGSGIGNLGGVEAEAVPWHDQLFSGLLTLPPLGAVWLVPE
jgi:1,4-alpha-glucan branching enzyme